jgi:hypothetical protein
MRVAFGPTRIATLALIVVAAIAAGTAAAGKSRGGVLAASLADVSADSNNVFVVTKTSSESHLRVGDRVAFSDPADLAAYRFMDLRAGSTIPIQRLAPAPPVTVAEPVVAVSRSSIAYLRVLRIVLLTFVAIFIAIAFLVAIRGTSSGALSLACFFASIILMLNPTTAAWPKAAIFAYATVSGCLIIMTFLFAIDFATKFTNQEQRPWTRRFRTYVRVGGGAAIAISAIVAYRSFETPTTPPVFEFLGLASIVAPIVAFVVALALAFAYASPLERTRAAWVSASFGLGILGLLVTIAENVAGVPEPVRDSPLVLLCVMPLGCAYAILRYRLLDIAFVVNRATVFGITSVVVLAALALVDYGLQKLVGSWIVQNGASVQIALALGIGIATRPLHARIDAIVDDVFFRKRHEALAALKRFAHDVAFIDDGRVAIERSRETVARATEFRCAAFLSEARGSAFRLVEDRAADTAPEIPLEIDRNDPCIIRMRSTRESVELRDVTSAIDGDYAFPMFARNQLLGFLLCTASGSAVTLAPDERAAVAEVARALGLTLDLLRVESLEIEVERLKLIALRERRSGYGGP